jgi:hypothetical protein
LITQSQISPNHPPTYAFHGVRHLPVGAISPQQQQQILPHHRETARNPKGPISIQEFMNQNVNDFVASSSE